MDFKQLPVTAPTSRRRLNPSTMLLGVLNPPGRRNEKRAGGIRMRQRIKVPIVEDHCAITKMTKQILVSGNLQVRGIGATSDVARFSARLITPDIAPIDLGLVNDERGADVGARPRALARIGILYETGNAAGECLVRAVGEGRLKPHGCDDLPRAIEIVAEIVAMGAASGSYPEAFPRLGQIA